jgi:isopenicillin-N N-acyltransferase-like protein
MKTELLPIVDCAGSPRQRGRAHGEALRAVIVEKTARWRDAIGEAYGIPAETFLPRFLAATRFGDAIERYTPDLAEEVAGIAEGSGIGSETAYALQLMDEEWWFGGSAGDGHCSSLAIAPGGARPTIVAQTMDLPCWHDGAQALLRIQDPEAGETMVFTSAGMIGLMGVSQRGVGICVNTLWQLAVSPAGLPVAFAMRGALNHSTVAEAVAFLRDVPHASGQNYQIGDRQGIATVECSAGAALPLVIASGRSLHTNHPLASEDKLSPAVSLAGSDNSRARLESLRIDLEGVEVTRDRVKAALAAYRPGGEVSITAQQDAPATEAMTVGAVVYEIGERTSLSVCAGPPSLEAWREITLGA